MTAKAETRADKLAILQLFGKSPAFLPVFLGLYTLTLFLSACLLFSVQPLFGKLLLPHLGGSPSVWNSCMVFYQAVLFAGYVYAHIVVSHFAVRRQVFVHLAVFVGSLVVLPVGLPAALDYDGVQSPSLWVLMALSAGVGIPFFVVSTSAPLLQRWFSYSDHPLGDDPYFLYGASNIGSFAALLGYPVIIEPCIGLAAQARYWSYGFAALCLFVVLCGLMLYAGRWQAVEPQEQVEQKQGGVFATIFSVRSEIPALIRLRWLVLAFCPSALMLALTTYLTTDIASAPFLWVVPLSIYLFSFVIVFARGYEKIHNYMLRAHLVVFLPMAGLYAIGFSESIPIMIMSLVLFFLSCMVCHGELAKIRPKAKHLTAFYLVMSLGGALGGQFSALLAPVVFDWVAEYPVLLLLCVALRPGRVFAGSDKRQIWRDFACPLGLYLVFTAIVVLLKEYDILSNIMVVTTVLAGMGLCSVFQRRPLRMALFLGAIMAVGFMVSGRIALANFRAGEILRERNFFGVHYVRNKTNKFGESYRILMHGTTLHGAQKLENGHPTLEPLTYYNKQGPLATVFGAFDDVDKGWKVGLVGLGTGSALCYAKPTQDWTYFEIDRDIIGLASGPDAMFSFVEGCKPDTRAVLGDARMSLQKEADGFYNLMIIDAFSSDAIPVHLLTKEALGLYFDKLAKDGVLVIHISNRNLRLQPVVANLADALGLSGYAWYQRIENLTSKRGFLTHAHWVVLARDKETLAGVVDSGDWVPLLPTETVGVWTDDFSNLFDIIKWKK